MKRKRLNSLGSILSLIITEHDARVTAFLEMRERVETENIREVGERIIKKKPREIRNDW